MIPEYKLDEVKKALHSTFSVTAIDDIKELTTGLSNALVFRIVVSGKPYLLKIARTDALNDPTLYYYACMKTAAKAGLAPKVWYAGIEDGICVTDFVSLQPFSLVEAKIKLADLLRTLHQLPPFSKSIHSIDTANRFAKKFRKTGILPGAITDKLFKSFEQIAQVYPRNKEDLVPSHNDLKPENILYDGKQIWLSDWEAAFTNDRYSDLSIVANFIVANESDETEFLNRYFTRNVTEYERSKFYLMRQVMHISYFTVFMIIVAATTGKQININTIAKHDFRKFHNRIWAGEIDLALEESRLEYALVHMEQLRQNLKTRRFKEALKIVSKANPK